MIVEYGWKRPRIVTIFDFSVIGIVVLSTLFAFVCGVVRELIAIVAWIVGFFLALAWNAPVAEVIPGMASSPGAKQVIAFAVVFIAVLIAGAIVAWLLSKIIHAAGLGFVDRFLGGVFGIARGALIVLLAVLVAGLTSLPRAEWWQNALLGPPVVTAALMVRQWLPPIWAERLDYSAAGRRPERPVIQSGRAPEGELEQCAELLA